MQENDYLLTVSARQKALTHGKEAGSFLLYGEEAYRILRHFFEGTEIYGQSESRFTNHKLWLLENEQTIYLDNTCDESYFFNALHTFLGEVPEDLSVEALIQRLKIKTQQTPLQLLPPSLEFMSPRVMIVIKAILDEPFLNVFLLLSTTKSAHEGSHLVQIIHQQHGDTHCFPSYSRLKRSTSELFKLTFDAPAAFGNEFTEDLTELTACNNTQKADFLQQQIKTWAQQGEYEKINLGARALTHFYLKESSHFESTIKQQDMIETLWTTRFKYAPKSQTVLLLDEVKQRITPSEEGQSEFEILPPHRQIEFYIQLLAFAQTLQNDELLNELKALIFQGIQVLSPTTLKLPELFVNTPHLSEPHSAAVKKAQKQALWQQASSRSLKDLSAQLVNLHKEYDKTLRLLSNAKEGQLGFMITQWMASNLAEYSEETKKIIAFQFAKKYQSMLYTSPDNIETVLLELKTQSDAILTQCNLARFFSEYQAANHLTQQANGCYWLAQSLWTYLLNNELYGSDLLKQGLFLLKLERAVFFKKFRDTQPFFRQIEMYGQQFSHDLFLESLYLSVYPHFKEWDQEYFLRAEIALEAAILQKNIGVIPYVAFLIVTALDFTEPDLKTRYDKKQALVWKIMQHFLFHSPEHLSRALILLPTLCPEQQILHFDDYDASLPWDAMIATLNQYSDSLLTNTIYQFLTPRIKEQGEVKRYEKSKEKRPASYLSPFSSQWHVKLILAASGQSFAVAIAMVSEMLSYIAKNIWLNDWNRDETHKSAWELVTVFVRENMIDELSGHVWQSTAYMAVCLILASLSKRINDLPQEMKDFLNPPHGLLNQIQNHRVGAHVHSLPIAQRQRILSKHASMLQSHTNVTNVALRYLQGERGSAIYKTVEKLLEQAQANPNKITNGVDLIIRLMSASQMPTEQKLLDRGDALSRQYGLWCARAGTWVYQKERNPISKDTIALKKHLENHEYPLPDDEPFCLLLEAYQEIASAISSEPRRVYWLSDFSEQELRAKEQLEILISLLLQQILIRLGVDANQKNVHFASRESSQWHVFSSDVMAAPHPWIIRSPIHPHIPEIVRGSYIEDVDYQLFTSENPALDFKNSYFTEGKLLVHNDFMLLFLGESCIVYADNITSFDRISSIDSVPIYYFALFEMLLEKLLRLTSGLQNSPVLAERNYGRIFTDADNDTTVGSTEFAFHAIDSWRIEKDSYRPDYSRTQAFILLKKLAAHYPKMSLIRDEMIRNTMSSFQKEAPNLQLLEASVRHEMLDEIDECIIYDALPFYHPKTGVVFLSTEILQSICDLASTQHYRVGFHLSLFLEQYRLERAIRSQTASLPDFDALFPATNNTITPLGAMLVERGGVDQLQFYLVFEYLQSLYLTGNAQAAQQWIPAVKSRYITQSLGLSAEKIQQILSTKSTLAEEISSLRVAYQHIKSAMKWHYALPDNTHALRLGVQAKRKVGIFM